MMMPHRYQAPQHTSEVFTATGPKRADKHGAIELPDDAPHSDHVQLSAAGCVPIADDPAPPKGKPAKGDDKD